MKINYIISDKLLKEIPEQSGVYIFKDLKNSAIYIGKAKNLRKRISNYFTKNLEIKTKKMVSNAKFLTVRTVNSEIEALLLESKLVKKYKPKYNIELKDDKSPLYIGITKDEFPRVLTLRQTQIADFNLKKIYGPFINATIPRNVLKMFRKIVPFSSHKVGARKCVYYQIGLCKPCPTKNITSEEKILYLKNVTKLQNLLNGKIKKVKKELENELKHFSSLEMFEEAKVVLEQIKQIDFVLQKHIEPDEYLKNPNFLEDIRKAELAELREIISRKFSIIKLNRIECFDIAHLAGSHPTASMVTFINGEPEKKYYRHFKINQKNSLNDFASLQEVLIRRSKYFDKWGKPDLIIIDGGKGQISATKDYVGNIPIVGLAKREETLIFFENNEFSEIKLHKGYAKNLVQRIRDEAHRFARRLHHKLVSDDIMNS